MGKGKKAKRQDDDWENDLQDIAKETGIQLGGDNQEDFEIPVTKKKEKKGKKKTEIVEDSESDKENDAFAKTQPSKSKPSFNALLLAADDSGDEQPSDHSEDDEAKLQEKPKIKQNDINNSIDSLEISSTTEKKKGKGKKRDKAKTTEEEDIDNLLADLEISDNQKKESKKSKKKGKKSETIETGIVGDDEEKETEKVDEVINELEDTTKSKKEKEKKKPVVEENEDEDEGPKIKTAAQKKAEKKEKEKRKREAQKAAQKKSDKTRVDTKDDERSAVGSEEGVKTAEDVVPDAETTQAETATAEKRDDKAESGESDEEGETKDKKKKKKKKKKGEEETKKTKKVGKAAIKQIQEALEKRKEEEERLRQEEEAKIKALEEAENKRLEKLRLEQERKEKKRQKDKERKERMKKEGKFLTPQQKEAKKRAELMLMAMKNQGIEVPSKEAVTERKKVTYGSRKPKNKQNQQHIQETTEGQADASDLKEEIVQEEDAIEAEKKKETVEEKEDDLPDSWDQIEDDDVKDSWDAESDQEDTDNSEQTKVEIATNEVEKQQEVAPVKKVEAKEASKETSEESEESEEETSSEDEEEEEESSEEESESESEDEKLTPEKIKERARERIMKRREEAEQKRSTDKLRCPVICVLGHVDTGKTKILDKIRHTHVQDGEAGGITQQIGATWVPVDAVKEQSKMVKEFQTFDLRLPGLLIIDTPGHESFRNLRSRGSNLCDMAILVVDIMHGLEPQTLESIELLRKKQTPFVVALNKIDRLFEWKRGPTSQIEDTIKKQKKNTKIEFEERMQQVIREFAEQGLNAAPFYKNKDEKVYISLVPTSAHSGDGMGDLMALICKLTQTRLAKKLAFSEEIQSTVMEVKALPGLGTTVDVILVNGRLREGDTIVTGGIEGPIVTQVRALLTPQPLRELRVKSQYIQHKEIEAAQGVKLTGKDLEKVMAGAPLFVAERDDEIEVYKDEVIETVSSTLEAIKVADRGVYVQASTLGSLEALLDFLKTSKIPYAGVNIGPVHKKDVMRASVMLEHEKMYAVILAFDVKVEREAQDFADKEGVKIFTADIIYHLFDKFTAYTEDYKQKKRDEFKHIAVFPGKLRVMPQHIFNSRDPIVVGVHIEAGTIRVGSPMVVPSKEFLELGFVTGIEANHKQMEKAVAGQEVCIKIEPIPGEAPKMYGRHFTHEDVLMTKINRESIDALKNYFREEMQKTDWQLIIQMKKIFGIL